eukprot:SAG31_NODE_804_length_11973_cov_8.406855_15_plen_174_part_00
MGLPTADRPTFDRRRCDIAAEVHRLSSPDERLRIRAASTIADAAATGAEDITDDVAAQRGVEALFPLLKSAATQPEALRAVAELAPAAPCQHAMIHVPGAIELLVDFLLSRNVGAQQHAARALANLAVCPPNQHASTAPETVYCAGKQGIASSHRRAWWGCCTCGTLAEDYGL